MCSLKKDDLVGYLLYLKDRGLESNSISRKLAAIKTFYKFLVNERKAAENVAAVLESPRLWKKLPDTLAVDEVDRSLRRRPRGCVHLYREKRADRSGGAGDR